jgi:hypothetical protein
MPSVTSRVRRLCLGAAWLILSSAAPLAAQVPSPETHFGFRMGADRQLADADAIERYFERVAGASNRVRIVDIGATTQGRRTIAAIVSSSENLRNLDRIRDANRLLADPRALEPDEAARLAATHKAVVAIGASIHAAEIGATQAANELLHRLASRDDPETLATLDQVVLILIPMLNPDGHRLVTDWYARQKGTAHEGGTMPWLYHTYAGHDINRDGFMMNLAENRNLARFFYSDWHPQVFLSMHQMEANGPRFFVPPNTDPIDPNYDPLIWRTASLLGGALAFELQRDGRSGVLSNGMYDYYWPGYEDSAPLGHNTVCLLTEAASVRVASPITLARADLRGGQKGLPAYREQINFPDPWPGGAWTLRDIVDYDLSAVNGLLKAVVRYREAIVQNFYTMGRRAVEAGRRGGPYAYIIPRSQRDRHAARKLRELLLQGYVEIQRAQESFRADGQTYPAGTDLVFMAQPFRAYAKTLLERQHYPDHTGAASRSERPYDVTGWTLPLQMGVDVRLIDGEFVPPLVSRLTDSDDEPSRVFGDRRPGHYVIDARGTSGALAAAQLITAGVTPAWLTTPREINGYAFDRGSIVIPASARTTTLVGRIARELGLRVDGIRGRVPTDVAPIGRARLAVHRAWTDNSDEGWTRWLFDTYGFGYSSIRDSDVKAGGLRARFDAIVIPSASDDRLVSGNISGFPPEYLGGLGQEGIEALRAFVADGGTLIALDQAAAFAARIFDLPVRNVATDGLYVPGSLLRIDLDATQPLAFGMDATAAAFFAFGSGFAARDASAANIKTIGRYGARGLLLSGHLEGEQVLAGQAAIIEAAVGPGRVILFGFPPQHRGQTLATFRLLFNAVLTSPPPATPSRRSRR